MLYSLKMRASRNNAGKNEHISGAERILGESEILINSQSLLKRAMSHSKGKPDFINLKVEAVEPEEIAYVDALPVRTIEVADAAAGQAAILELLRQLGIEKGAEIMALFKKTYGMRGAMLLDVDSLERLEPDTERGLRATYMDAESTKVRPADEDKNHFREALILASKVANAPGILGEICVSDDPDYVTGYVAARSIGYVRITKLKAMGSPDGGRIFLYRGDAAGVEACIDYLEHQRVLVRGVPLLPDGGKPPDVWQPLREDLERRRQAQLYRTMKVISSPQSCHVTADGEDMLLLASNSYLDLTCEPRVKAAAQKAIEDYGAGSGGSRLTTGNMPLHEALERDLAAFKRTEAALIFNTGYMANLGLIQALATGDSVIFSDELNHASIIDGCRLSRKQVIIYRHNDMADLEAKIISAAPHCGLIVSDAVFSMDGDIADLPRIMALAKKYHLLSMVDEAHATGVIGATGRGIVEHFGLSDIPDVLMGTLSKALAGEGGFVCGSKLLIDYIRNTARSFIFSTSLAPASVASTREALAILAAEPERVTRLQENTACFCAALRQQGIDARSESAIVPILIGDEGRALAVQEELYARRIFLSAIRYPTVGRGSARLRAAIMSTHTKEELTAAARTIAAVIKSL